MGTGPPFVYLPGLDGSAELLFAQEEELSTAYRVHRVPWRTEGRFGYEDLVGDVRGTLDELGVKDFEVTAWQGLFVPKGTPADITGRLTAETIKAINTPEVKAKLEDFGLEVLPTDGPALAAFIQKETGFWHALIRERKLSAE